MKPLSERGAFKKIFQFFGNPNLGGGGGGQAGGDKIPKKIKHFLKAPLISV